MAFDSETERSQVAQQPAFFFFALLLLVQITAAAAVQLANIPFGLIFSEVFFFAAPAALWALGANFRPAAMLKLRLPRLELVGLGALIGGANFMLAGTLQLISKRLMPPELAKRFDITHIFTDVSGVELALVVLAIGVFAPLGEEIAFRGYLQTVFRARFRDAIAIAITAVLFALLHFDPVGFVARVELGALFGFLVVWSGSVWPAIAAHAANNLIAAAAFLAALRQGTLSDTSEPEPLQALMAGLGALLVTAVLVRYFRSLSAHSAVPEAPLAMDPEAGHDFVAQRVRRAGFVWLVAAVAALGIFLGLDWRGAALSYIDAGFPSAQLKQRVPDEAQRKELRARLSEVRRAARRGEVDLEQYRSLRRALWGDAKAGAPLTPEQIEEAFAPFVEARKAATPAAKDGAPAPTGTGP